MHSKAHKTKWVLYYLNSGVCLYFDTEEQARIRAFECEGVCPVSIIAPIYGDI